MHSLECYFGVYFPRCCATREINTKITFSSAHKQFATRVHTLFSMYPFTTFSIEWTINSHTKQKLFQQWRYLLQLTSVHLSSIQDQLIWSEPTHDKYHCLLGKLTAWPDTKMPHDIWWQINLINQIFGVNEIMPLLWNIIWLALPGARFLSVYALINVADERELHQVLTSATYKP